MEREDKKSLTSALIQITPENDDFTLQQAVSSSGINEVRRKKIWDEVKKQVWLAGPLIGVSLFQYCIQMISVMLVGHAGELALAGASMGTSFASVTGFSLLLGMATALDTLCGQSYGAKQYSMLGIHMQRAMLILVIVSIPLAIIWINTTPILLFFGQDHDISTAAGEYACFMVPSLFAYGLLQCLVKFLQTQNVVLPMMICSGITTFLHILICWVMVFKSGLGFREQPWPIQSPTGSMSCCWCCTLSCLLHVLRHGQDFQRRPFTIFSLSFGLLFHRLLWSGNISFLFFRFEFFMN